LNAAKAEIAKGKQEIQKYVAGLEPSLRQVGQEAAQNIQGKFDELELSVDNKQNDLIDSLAQKYNDNVKALDARIDEMKAENRGLVDKALEAIGDTIKTINELKNMLMGVLRRAAGAIEKIIQDPIGFLGNLIAGLKQGFLNFKDNISQHLKQGFMGFLTGAMASTGIQMPKSFDMKGIFGLVTEVLGMTYEGIRPKAVKRMGEKNVNALESNFEMFVILKNEGTGGLWKFIQGQIGDLKSMVIDTLQSFIVEKVIISGITWILSLLNPASAFVRACKAIIDIIMFFIERASQIAELINAIIEAVTAIASGAIGGAAKAIENALSKSLPVVISFMASLLGIGGISDKVQEVIKRVRQPIEKAINWVIDQAVKFAKKIGGKLGFGKDKEKSKDGKENKSESEKKHAEMGNAAVQELAKKPSEEMSYEEIRASKEKQAKVLENKYNKELEKPVKMTITFKSPQEDKKDGDMDFHIHIGPNDFDTDGAVEGVTLSKDDGTEQNPFPLTWPKPPSANYPTLYFGGKTNKALPQPDLSAMAGQKDETDNVVKAYNPHTGGILPGGEKIGISSQYQIAVGKVVGPLSNEGTKGGGKINDILKKYGFRPKKENMDGDHVIEIQMGGQDVIENLWPLDVSINRSSGATLASTSVEGPISKKKVNISELKEDTSRKWYFKINKVL
jgi:hypothetical protein